MKTLNDLQVYNQVDGWKTYNIYGLSDDEIETIYCQLCDMYYTVESHVGRYIGTSQYFGYFQCRSIKIK